MFPENGVSQGNQTLGDKHILKDLLSDKMPNQEKKNYNVLNDFIPYTDRREYKILISLESFAK